MFYNNSTFDGRNAAANVADDGAIAMDKTPLLPGHEASFDNYTSYSRGINGIMVDLANTGNGFAASDFEFRVGNSNDPTSWPLLAAAPTVASRALAGGVTRVTVILPDNAVQNQWLQVKVLATGHTLLASPDVFYFGNAIGETGNHPSGPGGNAEVDVLDEAEVRSHHTATPAPLNDAYDFNRDRRVNATDELLARANCRSGLDALQWIDLAGAAAAAERAALAAPEVACGTGTSGEGGSGGDPNPGSTQYSVPGADCEAQGAQAAMKSGQSDAAVAVSALPAKARVVPHTPRSILSSESRVLSAGYRVLSTESASHVAKGAATAAPAAAQIAALAHDFVLRQYPCRERRTLKGVFSAIPLDPAHIPLAPGQRVPAPRQGKQAVDLVLQRDVQFRFPVIADAANPG